MIRIKPAAGCWTTTPRTDPQETPVQDLDLPDEPYQFHDENKSLANALFARSCPDRGRLYPEFPVAELEAEKLENELKAPVINVDDEEDADLKAAIAASLEEYNRQQAFLVPAVPAKLDLSQVNKSVIRSVSSMHSQMEVSDSSDDELATSQMLDEEVFTLRELIHGNPTVEEISEGVAMFESLSVPATKRLCSELNLGALSLDSAVVVTKAVIGGVNDVTHGSCCGLLSCLWENKLVGLTKNASRSLVGCMSDVIRRFPAAAINALLLPVWMNAQFGNSHGGLFCRILKDSSRDFKTKLTSELFACGLTNIVDAHVTVLQSLVASKVELPPSCYGPLIALLERNAKLLAKNNKFSKLLLTLLETADRQVLSSHKDSIKRCINLQETILKPSLETSFTKIFL